MVACSTESLGIGERKYLSPAAVRAEFPSPNRFDPYEALDTLEGAVGFHNPMSKLIHALRAYITGMER